VYEIMKEFATAMLVTANAQGQMEARPMQVACADEGDDVWFFTRKGGRLSKEIERDPMVLLTFQEENTAYLSLRGRARAVQDRAKAEELWKDPYKVWFPGGVEDPDLSLIAVDPVSAEYWDNRGANKLEYMFEAAKAYFKGQKPRVGDEDQHAQTTL
jgi:general stress protein 26